MSRYGIVNPNEFEEWLQDRYPMVYSEWEDEVSKWMDLEGYMIKHKYVILEEWEEYLRDGSKGTCNHHYTQ